MSWYLQVYKLSADSGDQSPLFVNSTINSTPCQNMIH